MDKAKIEKQNPNWKQWIPIYGIYQAIGDKLDKKPSVIDLKNHPAIYLCSAVYHGVITSGIIVGSLELLVK